MMIPNLLKGVDLEAFQSPETSTQFVQFNVIGPVLTVLNDLLAQQLLKAYAIGGGVALLYYTEPILTYDFDVFCAFPASVPLIDPTPVFAYLRDKGYTFGKEDRINIEGVPVQFIPAAEGLVAEALCHARPVTISGVPTQIVSLEYLIAIMLQLFRPKDRAKLDLLVNNPEVQIDRTLLTQILTTYTLHQKWERYCDGT